MSKNILKCIDFLYGSAILILIATGIRTAAYLVIGLNNERIFRTDLIIVWTVVVVFIILRAIIRPSLIKKSNN